MYVTGLIHIYTTWLIDGREMTHSQMTWRIDVCDVTHSYAWHESLMYVTLLIHVMHDVTQ